MTSINVYSEENNTAMFAKQMSRLSCANTSFAD